MTFHNYVRSILSTATPIVAAASVLAGASVATATTSVAPGFDLLHTTSAKLYDDNSGSFIEFEAFPHLVGKGVCDDPTQFNFGGGCLPVSPTDTIIQRKDEANEPSEEIEIEMVALSLVSSNPVLLPTGGSSHLYALLQKDLGSGEWIHGMDEGSSMTIDFVNKLFSSELHVTIDIFNDQWEYLFSVEKWFDLIDQEWSHLPPDLALLIPGVNSNLLPCATPFGCDFFPGDGAMHVDPSGSMHVVDVVITPIPAPILLMASAIAGLFGLNARRRRRTAA